MKIPGKLIATALGALAFCSLALYLAPSPSGAELWPGRRILLVDEAIPESDILTLLSRAGMKNVISESTQELAFSDYSKLVSLSLGEARSRLGASGSKDARLDAYVEGLPAWFHARLGAKSYRIYYIGRSFSSRPLHLEKLLSSYKGRFLLPESAREGQSALDCLGLALSLSLVLALLLMKRNGRLFRLVLLAPWPLLALRGGEAASAALLWEAALAAALPGLESLFGECRLSSGFRSLGPGLRSTCLESWPLLATALGFFALAPSLLLPSILCLGGGALGFQALLELYKEGRAERRLGFVPLRIAGLSARAAARASLSSRWTKLGLGALCLGLALSFVGRLFPASGVAGAPVGLSLPQPVAGGSGAPRGLPLPREAAALSASRDPDFLPDLADYLVHRAREEALFYLPLSEPRPDTFSPISIPSPGGRVAFSRSFDDAWARGAYRAAPSKGVESLLLSERRFVRAAILPLGSFKAQPLAPKEGLLYIILLAPPLLSLVFGKKMRRSGGRRENKQPL